MKKIFLALALAAFVAGETQSAKAHGGIGIAAGVVGGLAAGVAIGTAISQPAPVYYSAPAPVYYAPSYQAPAPAVVYQQPAPAVVYQQPAVVYTQPVYVRPAPVFSFYVGSGYYPRYYGGYGYRVYHRGWR